MNVYKKLIGNSATLAVGQLGSKLISFFLVPLYTYYLSTAEYGTVDLVVATVNMLLPIISASTYDTVLRFTMDKNEYTKDEVLTNALVIITSGFLLAILLLPIVIEFNFFGNNNVVIYMYIILFVQIIEKIFGEFTRANGQVRAYALNGIILTLSLGLLNIVFLIGFDMGIDGYFIAMILSYIISIIFLTYKNLILKHINLATVQIKTIKTFLHYSLPLIPNTLMWWVINTSSRYFILYYEGVSANGLFAVASKIPSLINLISQVFSQAWQLSAIEEYENKNKSDFYSNVFEILAEVLFLGTTVIIVFIKPIFYFLFAEEYYSAWKVVPFLLLGSVFSAFSSFLGTNYIASKETKGVFKSSLIGGIMSIIFNIVFISNFGLIGSGISSMMSFLTMWVIRIFDTKKYVDVKINWLNIIYNLIIIFVQMVILFIEFPIYVEIIAQVVLLTISIIVNKKLFEITKFFIKELLSRRR